MLEYERERLPVLKKLSDFEYDCFMNTYRAHMRTMGNESRENYTIDQIQKIKRNFNENCFEVYFKNGDWWHYTLNGSWY